MMTFKLMGQATVEKNCRGGGGLLLLAVGEGFVWGRRCAKGGGG